VAWWVALLVVGLAVGLGGPWWTGARGAARYPLTAADLASARAALAGLAVRAPDPDDDYVRARFGEAWADVDANGCDTRNDVLARDLRDVRLDPADPCVVLTGTLDDPYTGEIVPFARGPDSADVQIDHVVALADAWRTGARAWDDERRREFANDPANLLAVSGDTNEDKGDSDAAGWLPPQRGFGCVYVALQVRVKAAYGLWVTPDEHDAMAAALGGCVVAG
jgi:hypothetical protein